MISIPPIAEALWVFYKIPQKRPHKDRNTTAYKIMCMQKPMNCQQYAHVHNVHIQLIPVVTLNTTTYVYPYPNTSHSFTLTETMLLVYHVLFILP